MPKETNVLPNLRVDIPDYEAQTSVFTRDLWKQYAERMMLDDASSVMDGFRAEIANQGISPGQFTIYNGAAMDRDGQILNNEDEVNAARSATLIADGTYYVEVEFAQDEADADARAFWDPTFNNGTDPSGDVRPSGREFSQTVSTRKTQDWNIVQPISTTGFAFESDLSTTRMPVAVLQVAGGVITGGSTSAYRMILAEAISPGATTLRVLDARLLGDADEIQLDPGGGNQENVDVQNVDRRNGVITLVAGTVNSHTVQTRIQVVGPGTPLEFLVERADPAIPTAGTEDARARMFAGDEERGALIAQDPALAPAPENKSDFNVINLKRYIDFLAAELRELKFGTPTASLDGTVAPPTAFSNPRYYDRAGGVLGARATTLTIGDGVNSWGDFNVSAFANFSSTLAAARDALPTEGGVIYIKGSPNPYVMSGQVSFATKQNVCIIGESRIGVQIDRGSTTTAFNFTNMESAKVENLTFLQGSLFIQNVNMRLTNVRLDAGNISTSTGARLHAVNCDLANGLISGNGDNTVLESCKVVNGSGNAALSGSGTAGLTAISCEFELNNPGSVFSSSNGRRMVFNACRFVLGDATNTNHLATISETLSDGNDDQNINFYGCEFEGPNGVDIWVDLSNVNGVRFRDCKFSGGDAPDYYFNIVHDRVGTILAEDSVIIEGCRALDGANLLKTTSTAFNVVVRDNTIRFGQSRNGNADGAIINLNNFRHVRVDRNTFIQDTAGDVSIDGLADTYSAAIQLGDQPSTTAQFEITHNQFKNVDVAIQLQECIDGLISNNTHYCDASGFGIAFIFSDDERGGWDIDNLLVSNNVCRRMDALGANAPSGSLSVGTVGFILLAFGVGAVNTRQISQFNVEGNMAKLVGSNVAGQSRGVGVWVDGDGTIENGIAVQNNNFRSLQAPSGAAGPVGVQLFHTSYFLSVVITGNQFYQLGTTGTPRPVSGINVNVAARGCIISNNVFEQYGNTGATIGTAIITCDPNSQQVIISNNVAREVRYSGTALDGIHVSGFYDCNISNNVIHCSSGSQLGSGILMSGPDFNSGQTIIAGNSLPHCVTGIEGTFSTTGGTLDASRNFIIANNMVYDYDTWGIAFSGDATEGEASSVNIIGNCLFTSDTGGVSDGIFFNDTSRTIIGLNNLGVIRGTTFITGEAIDIDDHNGGLYIGNNITGRFTEGIDVGGMVDGLVVGNVIDLWGGVSSGSISGGACVTSGTKIFVAANFTKHNGTNTIVLGTNSSERANDTGTSVSSPNDPDAFNDVGLNYKRYAF
jgi:hypothetical protein